MKIGICSECKRIIHIDKACFFCGKQTAASVVSEAEVHENARESFAKAETLVAQGRFADAESALSEVMKWSPNSSEVHWLRLLARAKCRNDRELFFSGVTITDSPDYETAQRYASEKERQLYSEIDSACGKLKKALTDMIKSYNANAIARLELASKQARVKQFLSDKRNVLLTAWQELRKCEQEMKLLENESLYYIHECQNNMLSARNESASIRSELENTAEIGRKQYFAYKVKLDSLKKTAEIAKDEYYRLKSQHPSVASFEELCKKRDEISSRIDKELAQVRQSEKSIEAAIEEMNTRKREGNILLELAQAGSYDKIKGVLGQENFERAVQYALSN